MTDRIPLDAMTSDALDALYDERDAILAELGGRDEEARERWIQKQLDETGLKSMDFRNGATMELEPARELVAYWVGAARAMLGDAPNYSETPVSMEVKVAEDPERFAFTLQRVGKLTPHQARQQAEQRAEQAEAAIARVRAIHTHGPRTNTCNDCGQPWPCEVTRALDEPGPAEPTACDAYQPPTTPADSGLCARCGMYDYKHQEQPDA